MQELSELLCLLGVNLNIYMDSFKCASLLKYICLVKLSDKGKLHHFRICKELTGVNSIIFSLLLS